MKKCFSLLLACCCSLLGYGQFITTIAGNDTGAYRGDGGPASLAELNSPICIACDNTGNVYITDAGNSRVRKINSSGIISTIAGNGTAGENADSIATAAQLWGPKGIAIDNSGNLYIADCLNERICKVTLSGILSVVAGNSYYGFSGDGGQATDAKLWNPNAVAVDGLGNLYIADGFNHRIRKISASGIISTIAGNDTAGYTGDGGPAEEALLNTPFDIIADKAGNVYFSDYNSIRKINIHGIITTIAGIDSAGYSGDSCMATAAKFHNPSCLSIDNFNSIYIADQVNNRIRKIDSNGVVTTIAGDGIRGYGGDNNLAISAMLNYPNGVCIDHLGNIYIGDSYNNRIRYIASTVFVKPLLTAGMSVNVYPNPNKGRFVIEVLSDILQQIQVEITSISGQKMKEFVTIPNKPLEVLLDAPAGVYFLSITINDEKLQKELIVTQ